MLFTNSNPSSCPFSGCSVTSGSSCTGYYSAVADGCSTIGLSVTTTGSLSIQNIVGHYYCCQYVMTCSANG